MGAVFLHGSSGGLGAAVAEGWLDDSRGEGAVGQSGAVQDGAELGVLGSDLMRITELSSRNVGISIDVIGARGVDPPENGGDVSPAVLQRGRAGGGLGSRVCVLFFRLSCSWYFLWQAHGDASFSIQLHVQTLMSVETSSEVTFLRFQ